MSKPSIEQVSPDKLKELSKEQVSLPALDILKKNIQEIKSSVEQVKQQIDTVEKGKNNLTKDILDQKQKEIDAKKDEITAKKKETLDLITKIKIDAKLAALDKQVTQEVDDDEKYLNTLDINGGSSDKKNRFKEQWDAVTSKEEWKEHTLLNTGRVAIGIGAVALAYKGISWLFGSHNKDKNEDKNSDSKEESPSFWQKALKWAGLGIGGVLVWKNWDKIKDFFGDLLGKKNPENGPASGSYDKLPESQKQKYTNLSGDIDSYSASNKVSFSDKLSDDATTKGSIIFGLDKSSKSLSAFGGNDTLDYISGKTDRDVVDMGMDWLKAKGYECVGPYLSGLTSFASFLPDFATDPLKAITEWLKGGIDREKELSLYFREYLNIFNYVVEKKKLLLQRMAKAEIMGKDHIKDEPTQQQKDSIEKLIANEEWSSAKLNSYCLADLSGLTKEFSIEVSEESEEIKDIREHVQEERDDVLEKDAAGETAFSRAETDFIDGSLDVSSRTELIGVCENLLDDAFGTKNKKGFFEAYTHLITDIFAGNTEMAESLKDKTQVQAMIDEIRTSLITYVEKLKNNTFTQQDLQSLKEKTTVYFQKKEDYEVSLSHISDASKGFHPDFWKLLQTPWFAVLDIGKAFGYGKTNSWRERIGYGLGGFYVSGQTLYIASKFKSQSLTKTVMRIGGKTFIEVGKLPVTLGQKALNLALDRTFLTPYAWNDYILRSGFNGAEKERLLKYAFLKGEIDENRALHIAEELGSKTIKNVDALLADFGLKESEITLFKKYGSDKNLRKLMFTKDKLTARSWSKKVQYTIKDTVLKYDMEINPEIFKSLETIDTTLKTSSKETSLLMRGFLSTTKDLRPEMVHELLSTKSFAVGEAQAENIGKLIGKNMHNFTSIEDFKAYQSFFQKHYASHSSEAFVENSLRKWKSLKTLDAAKQESFIVEQSLDKSFLQRRLVSMKDNFKKSADALRKVKNRSPYPQQVEEAAQGLQELSQIDEGTATAMQNAQELGNSDWMLTMSKNKQVIQELSPLFKDKAFVKALGEAKTTEAIKDVFVKFNKESLFTKMPGEFTEILSKTKNTKKILDTMNYVEKYESLSKVMKILQNPSMKYAGRIFGRVLGVAGFAMGAFSAYGKFNEATEIAKTNQARADVKNADAWFESGYAVVGGIEAMGAFGALAGVESVCAFVPGIGWVAGGIILGASYFAKEAVFDTLDKYNKNYKDLLGEAPLLIKQHILTTILGSEKQDVAFGDWLVGSFKNLKHLTQKTGSEAIKALLYTEEWKRNPLAMFDITNTEMMAKLAKEKPPVTREDVAKAIDDVEQRVAQRYAYLKLKCGTYRDGSSEYIDVKKNIPANVVAQQSGLKYIDQLMLESQYSVDSPEKFETPQKLESQKKILKANLDKRPSGLKSLEALWSTDPKTLLYMYRYANEYLSHMQQFGTQDPSFDAISANIEYFNTYMMYVSLIRGIDISNQSQSFEPADFIKCREFFASYKLSKPLVSKELYGHTPKLQVVLYRIATEVIGSKANNSMEELKTIFSESHEKAYGLYFKDGDVNRLCVNGNWTADSEYRGSDAYSIQKLRADIFQKTESNDFIDIGTGDTILNKEIGKKYLAIIDQELKRI